VELSPEFLYGAKEMIIFLHILNVVSKPRLTHLSGLQGFTDLPFFRLGSKPLNFHDMINLLYYFPTECPWSSMDIATVPAPGHYDQSIFVSGYRGSALRVMRTAHKLERYVFSFAHAFCFSPKITTLLPR
jgi:hypothetical protein